MEAAREWISRARSDLVLARGKRKGVYLEDLCFHAQQAAEKAIKALLIRLGIKFPSVHDLAVLDPPRKGYGQFAGLHPAS